MRILRLLALLTIAFALPARGADLPVNPFRSIELRHGGHVIVRHGAVQRVSMLEGDPRCAAVGVGSDERLVIESSGRACHGGRSMLIEVVTPQIAALYVSNGGTLQTRGGFGGQPSLEAAVEQGGTIDMRSIAADNVEASVNSGGRIFTNVRTALTADVTSGGLVAYWGSVRDVNRVIRHGGVVGRGKAEDADKPLSEMGPDLAPIPPIPALPALPALPAVPSIR
jgi:hypothetical protein